MADPNKTKHVGNRLAFLGVVAWISVSLLFAGLFPELHQRLSAIWILSGLLGLVAAVGLAEVVKREMQEQAQLIETFKTEAYTDSLTRLPNRRALDDGLESHLALARRNGHSLALIILDIDFFKGYNDRHGHGAGDDLLRVLATIMQDSFRDTDIIARYGGEEFAAILPQTEQHSAIRVARRLRQSVKTRTKHESTTTDGVTVSIGLTMATTSDTSESLLRRADDALYTAKDAGRDCAFINEKGECRPLEPVISHNDNDAPDLPDHISIVG